VQQWLNQPSPRSGLIYVQPGRAFKTPSFLPALLRAVEHLPYRLVIDLLRSDEPAGSWPAHVFAQRGVGIQGVLGQASCVITGGHGTSALAALTAGVPPIILYSGSGTDDLGYRCSRAGVGWSHPARLVTNEQLARAIGYVHADSSLRARCAEMAKSIAHYEGPSRYSRCVDVLEQPEWLQGPAWWKPRPQTQMESSAPP
jgi:UDP:flavonoid glycosyltransferase YjiC (YdhE family)